MHPADRSRRRNHHVVWSMHHLIHIIPEVVEDVDRDRNGLRVLLELLPDIIPDGSHVLLVREQPTQPHPEAVEVRFPFVDPQWSVPSLQLLTKERHHPRQCSSCSRIRSEVPSHLSQLSDVSERGLDLGVLEPDPLEILPPRGLEELRLLHELRRHLLLERCGLLFPPSNPRFEQQLNVCPVLCVPNPPPHLVEEVAERGELIRCSLSCLFDVREVVIEANTASLLPLQIQVHSRHEPIREEPGAP